MESQHFIVKASQKLKQKKALLIYVSVYVLKY